MSVNGFHHIALKADDFAKTCNFYTKGLGFKEVMRWEMDDGNEAVMLDSGNDNYLEIFAGRDYEIEENGAYLHLAFSTDNCEKMIKKAEKAGAEVTMEPTETDIPSTPVKKVKIAFCKGPDGEIIEFFQER
ncbi:MAG: VOC family protein [bacterium]